MRRLADSVGTVDKLGQALLSCLNEKEYAGITITELSERAGINRTTFYLLFGSKDELLTEMCDSVVDLWFQPFFDLNITKNVVAGNADMEKELFLRFLAWIRTWRFALRRITNIKTEQLDGLTLFAEAFEKRMIAQSVFQTEDEKKRKKYSLFIRLYSVGLAYILKWWLDEEDSFEPNEFHDMIERLRYKGYYSILSE